MVNGRGWQVGAAVSLSLLMHAVLLIGLTDLLMPSATVASGSAPMQARVIPVAAVAPEPKPERTPPEHRPEPAPEGVVQRAPIERPARAASVQPQAAPARASTPLADSASKSASAGPATPAYRLAAELDPPPHPLGDIDPEYPAAAGLRQGTVVLRLLIGADGAVDDVVVVSASPEGLFEASAVEAFGKARFSPGRFLGVPVRSQLTIAVDYTPTNRGGAVSGQGGMAPKP
ncbi:TonB family protein [Variovorax sp. J22R24]|uniref:TonB family protein n=1 Tax=Variovorax gracilis TaxID=3053502 RepID=UPI002576F5C1|nr:TonB family protein [Variovorax sp. J22R24]MDM0106024.1 TonB family protein [Variovorax sp. J22R24]